MGFRGRGLSERGRTRQIPPSRLVEDQASRRRSLRGFFFASKPPVRASGGRLMKRADPRTLLKWSRLRALEPPNQAMNLEREHPPPAAPGSAAGSSARGHRVGGINRVAVGVLGDVLNLLEPDRPTRAADVQPVERGPRGDSPREQEGARESKIQVRDGRRAARRASWDQERHLHRPSAYPTPTLGSRSTLGHVYKILPLGQTSATPGGACVRASS